MQPFLHPAIPGPFHQPLLCRLGVFELFGPDRSGALVDILRLQRLATPPERNITGIGHCGSVFISLLGIIPEEDQQHNGRYEPIEHGGDAAEFQHGLKQCAAPYRVIVDVGSVSCRHDVALVTIQRPKVHIAVPEALF